MSASDERWRIGTSWGLHVYQGEKGSPGERPVATFHYPADAQRAVNAVNAGMAGSAGTDRAKATDLWNRSQGNHQGIDLIATALAAERTSVCADADDRLRETLLTHHPIAHSETSLLSGCRCGKVKLGEDVIAHVVAQLHTALATGGFA